MAAQEDQPPPARFGTDRAETQRAYEQALWRDERPCAELHAHYQAVLRRARRAALDGDARPPGTPSAPPSSAPPELVAWPR